MIIALTGSHGTGKSTLLEHFKAEGTFECIDSVTRKSTSIEERRVEEADLNEAQLRIAENIVQKMTEIIADSKVNPDKVYLLDRSVIDFLSYCKAFTLEGRLSLENFEKINSMCKGFIQSIDLYVFLRPEFSLVDDGSRSTSLDLQKKVDQFIESTLLWNKVRCIKATGSIKNRVAQIKRAFVMILLNED